MDETQDLERLFEDFRQRGDVKALARVFDAAAPELYAIARYLARREGEAEDLVQQTFLVAIERAASFDAQKNLMPWLLGILANQARKRRDRIGRDVDAAVPDVEGREDPVRDAEAGELRDAVSRAVASLPAKQARILTLHLVEDHSPKEIAAVLALEPGTARVQLHRALKMLRESLPTGFAGAIAAPLGSLDSVRTAVLASAQRFTPLAPLTPVNVAPGLAVSLKVAILVLLALGITGGAWLAAPLVKSAFADAPKISALQPDGDAEARSPAGKHALAEDTSDVRANAVAAKAVLQSLPSKSIIGPDVEILGRLLRPDGSPAVGASLVLKGREANRTLVEDYGVPTDWKDPAPIISGPDGRFRIVLAPPRAFQFFLDATLAGCARISWRWSQVFEKHLDLGEARFQLACTLVVRVVDSSGAPMERKYQISAQPVAEVSSGYSGHAYCSSTYDPETHMGLLEDVPAGRVTVSASSALSDRIPEVIVEAKPDQPTQIDLVDPSPSASARIVVNASTKPFYSFRVEAAHVLLRREGEEPRTAEPNQPSPMRIVFDRVAPGDYSLEIDDPRFEHWVKADVKPGDVVRADLKPSAWLHVDVRSGATHEPIEPSALRIRYLHVNFTPDSFDLRARGSAASRDSMYAAVPGESELLVEAPGFPVQTFALGELLPHDRRDVVVELKPGLAIRGRVLAKDGRTPESGIDVQLTRGKIAGHALGRGSTVNSGGKQIPSFDFSAQSTTDGTFAFEGVSPGAFTLRAVWSPWLVADRTLNLNESDASTMDLVEPPSGVLEGDVLLPEGAVHDGLRLSLRSGDRNVDWPAYHTNFESKTAWPTLENGHFRFGPLPVGRLNAVVMIETKGPFGDSANGTSSAEIEIESGKTTNHDFDLRTTMRGRLKLAVFIDGIAAIGGMAECAPLDRDPKLSGFGCSISGDGTTLISGIDPGRLHLWIDAADRSWSWLDPQEIYLAPGQQLEIEARITLAEHDVRFLDARDDTPLVQHEIKAAVGSTDHQRVAWKGPDEPTPKTETDVHGIVKLKLPIGTVTFSDPATNASATLDWGRDAASPLDVRLKPRD